MVSVGLSGVLKAVFNPFKAHIDRDFQAWNEKCKRLKDNGKKGGRPKAKKPNGYKKNQIEGDKDKDKVKDKVNDNKYKEEISIIVDYLNNKCSTKYRENTPKTRSLISTLLKQGYTVENFKKVIDTMYSKWNSDDKMRPFLRPLTLFNATKFEGYLNSYSIKPQKSELHYY